MAKREATERQKLVAQKVIKGSSMTQAMRDSGYSENYAKTSTKLKKKKSFRDLIDKMLPEKDLARVHRQLLNKKESFISNGKIVIGKQSHADAKGALDMGYKLRGNYEAEKVKIVDDLDSKTDAELDARIAELEKKKNEPAKKRATRAKRSKKEKD